MRALRRGSHARDRRKVDWKRLEAEARKMIESGFELADRIEVA